jgi:hypothetical protein
MLTAGCIGHFGNFRRGGISPVLQFPGQLVGLEDWRSSVSPVLQFSSPYGGLENWRGKRGPGWAFFSPSGIKHNLGGSSLISGWRQ